MITGARSNSGNLGNTSSVSKLTPVRFIRKQALIVRVYMSNPVNQPSLLVSPVNGPKMGVFYPLLSTFPSFRRTARIIQNTTRFIKESISQNCDNDFQ